MKVFRHCRQSVGVGMFALLLALVAATPCYAISPAGVLDKVEGKWNDIRDFSCDVFLNAERLDGGSESHWGTARMVRPMSLRIDLYSSLAESRSATAQADLILYTQDGVFFQYSRDENTLYAGAKPEETLLPFVLALAGKEGFDRKTFEKHYYIKAEEGVPEVDLDGQTCYLLQIEPKGEDKELKPRRRIWIDQETLFPVRLEIEDSFGIRFIRMMEGKANTGLDADLEPTVPEDAEVIDLTEQQGLSGTQADTPLWSQ